MTKRCCICKAEKETSEFSKNGRAKDGLQTLCKVCALEYSRRPEQKKRRSELASERWRSGKVRDDRYQELYGISVKDYYKMLFDQGELCKICGQLEKNSKPLSVDHCHKTGKVRGLLCKDCNTALGLFRDNKTSLEKATAYLAAHETQKQE